MPAPEATPKTAPTAPKDQPEAAPATPKDIPELPPRPQDIVRRNVMWAMGVGLVPMPIVDLVGITGVQVKMIRELADHYKVPFSEERTKTIISALVGGVGSMGLAGVAFSLIKMVPFLGQAAGVAALPITAGAATHAVGVVFTMHFEAGGTLLDFDAQKMRGYFQREFLKSKDDLTASRQAS